MPTIRIDDEIYSWLKSQAEPFEDTPNSVLRRLARLDKKASLVIEQPVVDDKKTEERGANAMEPVKSSPAYQKQITGKDLARRWGVSVVQALYHKDGNWYQVLHDFPGALFDPKGYVVFHSESEYNNSPYLQHGQELHVPGGIHAIPGYQLGKPQKSIGTR